MTDEDDVQEVELVRERPRRRPKRDCEDEDPALEEPGDVTGGLIPYKNTYALFSYYVGVFSLIPCAALVLAPVAIVLGFLGWRYQTQHPRAGGKAHAVVGIVLGSLTLTVHISGIVFVTLMAISAD